MYVKDNINVSRRDDFDFDDLEGIWVQIKINGKKILFGIFYILPKSTQDIWRKLESSIEMAINDTAIDDVIITGDFNDNQLDYSRTKISFLLTKYSLLQMIDEPTHFTEHSSSLIDLILTNNVNRLIYTRVGPALTDQIRYHCPVMNYPKTPTIPFKRKIWLYEHADYEKLRQNLFNISWDSLFLTDDIELITNEITNAILSAAESSIPSKIVTIRKGGPKWLSCKIRKMIRQKNRIHRKAKHFNNPMHWNKYRKIRNEVTSLVRNTKDKYNNDLIKKNYKHEFFLQKLVEHSKQISGIKGSDMSIPPILHNDNLIFDDIERASLFNIYFSKQSEIDGSNSNIPNLSHVANQISEIKLCENEVEDVLKVINPTIAPGPDLINPRLLKEAAPIIKHPLCTLFNLSLYGKLLI